METAVWGYRTPWGKPSPEDVNDLDGARALWKGVLEDGLGDSLVAQWLGLCASTAGGWVPSLSGNYDPACHGAEPKNKQINRNFKERLNHRSEEMT